jgi:hypothetical protein
MRKIAGGTDHIQNQQRAFVREIIRFHCGPVIFIVTYFVIVLQLLVDFPARKRVVMIVGKEVNHR